MTQKDTLPVARFLETLEIVYREASHLAYSWSKLYSRPIDAAWVRGLEAEPQLAETLEAFVSRFGRMQDTIAGKLLPRWLLSLAEVPGSQIEILNRSARLGILQEVEPWLEARNLRNRLVHEYAHRAEDFAEDINLAKAYADLLVETYNRVRDFAAERMGLDEEQLPDPVRLLGHNRPRG